MAEKKIHAKRPKRGGTAGNKGVQTDETVAGEPEQNLHHHVPDTHKVRMMPPFDQRK